MTKRQSVHLLSPFNDGGYVLNFTKQTLSDFIFDLTGLELEDYTQLGNSNGKCLTALLMNEPQHADIIIDALIKHREQLL